MKPEVIWSDTPELGLDDMRSFARSLDFYEAAIDLDRPNGNYVYIGDGAYQITPNKKAGAFKCPHCGAEEFEVLEGEFQGKPALGLYCRKCETHGAVFPYGM